MRIAARAKNLCSAHAIASVLVGGDVFAGEGLKETRPARAGIEFGVGGEQREVATDTRVNAGFFVVVKSATERRLGPFSARDLILLGRQLLLPFAIGLYDAIDSSKLSCLPVLTQKADLHSV
jgi:hypothetical protein